LHTAPIFLIVFFLLGVGAGIINVFRTISKTDD
jgi:F0F1-type ATP synthase assembly protein I